MLPLREVGRLPPPTIDDEGTAGGGIIELAAKFPYAILDDAAAVAIEAPEVE